MFTNALTFASAAFGFSSPTFSGTAAVHDICANLAADRPQDTNWG